MIIDLTDRIKEAKAATAAWATEAGFVAPPSPEAEEQSSKRARDIARILKASSFGCQQRNVKLLVEAITGESIPYEEKSRRFTYENVAVGCHVGTIVVAEHTTGRAGMVMRLSQGQGRPGIRYASGEVEGHYPDIRDIRPATEDEIEQFFSDFFSLSASAFEASDVDEDEGPF